MKVIRDEIMLCTDCLFAAANGDFSGLESDERIAEIKAGLEKLGQPLVMTCDSETGKGIHEFSRVPCACCGSRLAGSRFEFAVLGEE